MTGNRDKKAKKTQGQEDSEGNDQASSSKADQALTPATLLDTLCSEQGKTRLRGALGIDELQSKLGIVLLRRTIARAKILLYKMWAH